MEPTTDPPSTAEISFFVCDVCGYSRGHDQEGKKCPQCLPYGKGRMHKQSYPYQPPTPPSTDAPPPMTHEPSLCAIIRDQMEATTNQFVYDTLVWAHNKAITFEQEDASLRTQLATIRHALAVPADEDLCEWLKKLYFDWEMEANAADDLRTEAAALRLRLETAEAETNVLTGHIDEVRRYTSELETNREQIVTRLETAETRVKELETTVAGQKLYIASCQQGWETAEAALREAQVEIARRTSFVEKERDKYKTFPAIYAPKLGPLQCYEGATFGDGPVDVPVHINSRVETLEAALKPDDGQPLIRAVRPVPRATRDLNAGEPYGPDWDAYGKPTLPPGDSQ